MPSEDIHLVRLSQFKTPQMKLDVIIWKLCKMVDTLHFWKFTCPGYPIYRETMHVLFIQNVLISFEYVECIKKWFLLFNWSLKPTMQSGRHLG